MKSLIVNIFSLLGKSNSRSKFDYLMEMASSIGKQNPQALADFIVAILRPLQAEQMLGVAERKLHDAPCEILPFEFFAGRALATAFGSKYCRRLASEPFRVQLNRHVVFPTPWHRVRFSSAISNIGSGKKRGTWKQDHVNHSLALWLPWGIGFVGGGNHSIAAGLLIGEGELTPSEVYDLSEVFSKIRCDGNYYFDVATDKEIAQVTNQRLAAVFEIGRLMNNMGVSAFPDAERCPYVPKIIA